MQPQPVLPKQQDHGGIEGVELCLEELLKSKTNANRRSRYIDSLEAYLRQFIKGREKRPLCDFVVQDIENWLSNYKNPHSRQTWLNRLSTMFSFAVRRRYINLNPCDQIERITIDIKPPKILSPEQAKTLVKACPNLCRPYLILALYAGIRPEELGRLDWKDINFETKKAWVDGKTRRRRYVPLEPIALNLLQIHPLKSGPVAPSNSTLDRWRIKAVKILGFDEWPQDLLRHTAASYLIALYGDAGKVALTLGNSVKILMGHYSNPPTEAESIQFWSTDKPQEGCASARSATPLATVFDNLALAVDPQNPASQPILAISIPPPSPV